MISASPGRLARALRIPILLAGLVLAGAGASALTAATVQAQTPPAAPVSLDAAAEARLKARFDALDSNHDGVITREEWVAAGRKPKGFDRLDAAHDGRVTFEEFRAAALAAKARRAGKAGPAADPAARIRARFDAIDTNHDGFITREEWLASGHKDRGFDRLDPNHAGKIDFQTYAAAAEKMRLARQAKGVPAKGVPDLAPPAPAPAPQP